MRRAKIKTLASELIAAQREAITSTTLPEVTVTEPMTIKDVLHTFTPALEGAPGLDIQTATTEAATLPDRNEALRTAARRLCDEWTDFRDNKQHMEARIAELREALA